MGLVKAVGLGQIEIDFFKTLGSGMGLKAIFENFECHFFANPFSLIDFCF